MGEALEVARADAGGSSRGGQREAVVDRCDVRLGLANVDDEAGERTCGVELCCRPVEDADCRDIEEVEDLARALVGIALGGAKTGRGTRFGRGGVAGP